MLAFQIGVTFEELIEIADKKMYVNKQSKK